MTDPTRAPAAPTVQPFATLVLHTGQRIILLASDVQQTMPDEADLFVDGFPTRYEPQQPRLTVEARGLGEHAAGRHTISLDVPIDSPTGLAVLESIGLNVRSNR